MEGVAARRAALEDKRRRLEEMKARRQQRGAQQAEDSAAGAASSGLDEYIDGLLAKPPPMSVAVESSSGVGVEGNEAQEQSSEVDSTAAASSAVVKNVLPVVETVVKAPVETFDFGTQTDFPWSLDEATDTENQSAVSDTDGLENDEDTKANPMDSERDVKLNPISPHQKEQFVQTPNFGSFLNIASKKVEKFLNTTPSVAEQLVNVDYTTDRVGESKMDGTADGSSVISTRSMYECPEWTKNRSITCIDWSNTYKELVVAGYHLPSNIARDSLFLPQKSSLKGKASPQSQLNSISPSSASVFKSAAATASDGLVLVWNLAMANRPEHIFSCWSPIVAVKFHPTDPHLVIGCCHSGQVVLWDVRAGRLPVQKSALGFTTGGFQTKCHNYPITSLEVIDGGSALVTSDSEGKINFWSLGQLREPVESIKLPSKVSALSVAEGGTIICGDDSGDIYSISAASTSVSRSSSGVSRRVVKKFETLENNHFSFISAISAKNFAGSTLTKSMARGFAKGSSGLVLTCGLDWTTKIWAPAYSDNPILTLLSHSYDYFCDVQWSPTNPCLFASASSNGRLGLWDLAESFDRAVTGDGIVVRKEDEDEQYALSKLRWSGDGRRLAIGSGDQLHILSLYDDVAKAKEDDETKMMERFTSRRLIDP